MKSIRKRPVQLSIIFSIKPDTILELGSGVSTIISAYCLKKIGNGKIISLDHEKEYYRTHQKNA